MEWRVYMSHFTDWEATGMLKSMALDRTEPVAAPPAFEPLALLHRYKFQGEQDSYDLCILVQF